MVGGSKDGTGKSNELDSSSVSLGVGSLPETDGTPKTASSSSPEKQEANNAASALLETEVMCSFASVSQPETKILCGESSASLPESGSTNLANVSSDENQEIPSATPALLYHNDFASGRSNADEESFIDNLG